MKKEEILKKQIEEGADEGCKQNNRRGDSAGFWELAYLSLLIMIYQGLVKLPFGDIPAVLFCFMSIGALSRYKADKDAIHIVPGVITGSACLACPGWCIWKTVM